MSKSHVTMQQEVCCVCGQAYDTGAILMDKRVREVFEHKTVTGWGLCPEHAKLDDEGYVALVAVDESKSTTTGGNVTLEGAYRTGAVAHIRRAIWDNIFDVPAPDGPLCFVEPEVVDQLNRMMEASDVMREANGPEGPGCDCGPEFAECHPSGIVECKNCGTYDDSGMVEPENAPDAP